MKPKAVKKKEAVQKEKKKRVFRAKNPPQTAEKSPQTAVRFPPPQDLPPVG
ncbi:MAG: hypothetical protein LUM44_18380 [Pyrinomonadaceae bacterium]|nr:hypothetical protein [Pyrinomonadaceae bacterium]